jgi:hypothetical protein
LECFGYITVIQRRGGIFPSPLSILPATAAASRGEDSGVDPHHLDADPDADSDFFI